MHLHICIFIISSSLRKKGCLSVHQTIVWFYKMVFKLRFHRRKMCEWVSYCLISKKKKLRIGGCICYYACAGIILHDNQISELYKKGKRLSNN